VLQDNGGNNLSVTTDGTFPFTTRIARGGAYAVTVLTQPSVPAQRCTVATPASGSATANVTVAVGCTNVGKYVFVANRFDVGAGSVAAFTILPATGALTAVAAPYTPTGGESGPAGLALDPSGAYLYVADSRSADVSTWGISNAGALTQDAVAGSPASTGGAHNAPYSLAFDPAGFLYVGSNDDPNGTVEGFSVATGVLAGTPGSPYASGNIPYGIAVDATHKFVYATNVYDRKVSEYAIGTGGNLDTPNYDTTLASPYAVAVHPTGPYVYITDNNAHGGASGNSVEQYTYDTASGLLTAANSYSVGAKPQGIAIDPTGSFLYVSNSGDGTVSAFTIDATTGALMPVTGSPFTASGANSPATPTALAIDPSSQYLYVANGAAGTISVFTNTAATGALVPGNLAVPCTNGAGGPQAIVVQ
jgi:6-phosphogluconolactonase (cycloisomerase 2 family)